MKWTRPVMNKTADDFMNVSDIKRVVGDIDYIYQSLWIGASIPVPNDVAPMVAKLKGLNIDQLVYLDDFDWIRQSMAYLVVRYNEIQSDQLVLPTFSAVDYLYMNGIETIMQRYKVNILAGWGL